MAIREVAASLPALGYRHHVFLSYARPRPSARHDQSVPVDSLLRQARVLRTALVDSLSEYFDGADVFLDADMVGGNLVDATLGRAIGESVCVIALCAPVYFAHEWCGREWAGGLTLSSERLGPGREYESLIPCTTKKFDERFYPLNAFPSNLVREDLSNLSLWFDGPTVGVPKPPIVERLVERVLQIMETISTRNITCNGAQFDLPAAPESWRRPMPAGSLFPLRAA